jgi:hypothetical protein
VLQRAGLNVFVIAFPPDPSLSSTFNVGKLTAHTIWSVLPNDPLEKPPPVPYPYPLHISFSPSHKETVDVVLDEQVVFAKDGGVYYFLIHWKGRPNSDHTWVPSGMLHQAINSMGSSSPHPGRMMRSTKYKPEIT